MPVRYGKTYFDMSSRHLVTRAKEHMNLDSNRKSTKWSLQTCSKTEINLYSSFTVLKKCSSEYSAKIHKAMIIKQSKPLHNKQLQYVRMVVPAC